MCIRDREGTDEYEGFTKYTLRDAYTAKITLSGESHFASIDTGTGEQTVYAGEDIVYEVICKDDFVVSKITYTPEGGTPQAVSYTHLDVYKRQNMRRPCPEAIWRR